MINTKPKTIIQLFFWTIILIGIHSCTKNESFTFEKHNFDTNTLLDCKTNDCASLDINLITIIDDRPVCKKMNTEIEKITCSILNVDENQPKQTLEEAILQFNDSYHDISQKYPDEIPPYEASIASELSFQCKSMISVLIDSYVFTGGAHGYGGITYINLDTKTGKQISNTELFKDYVEFKKYAEMVFRSKYDILKSESINSSGFFFKDDTFSLPENIGFNEQEVILYYNPYEISSYAEGPVEIKIKKEDVASYFVFDIL